MPLRDAALTSINGTLIAYNIYIMFQTISQQWQTLMWQKI